MAQLQPVVDPTGQMTPVEINSKAINLIMQEMNRGVDVTTIQRRAITPGQIKLLEYAVGPFKLHTGSTLAAGGYFTVALNIINTGILGYNAVTGQTYLPSFYIDLFVDPTDTSSISAIYAGGYIYPDGNNLTAAMANLTLTSYLRNSTPNPLPGGTANGFPVVSYVITIRNQDSSPHAYWAACSILLPADGNLNNGPNAVYIP